MRGGTWILGVVLALTACQPGVITDGRPAATRPGLIVQALVQLPTDFQVKATAADVHHVTFHLVPASDTTTVAAAVNAQAPLASPLTLQFPVVADGTYRLTAEAFGGADPASSLSLSGAILSVNSAVVSSNTVSYSTGTAFRFAENLQLKTGGTVLATVTGSGTNRIDAAVISGTTTQAQLLLAPTSFPVRNLPPGTYVLRVTAYDAGGNPTGTHDSDPVTVSGATTGYATSGAFTVAI